MEVGGAGQASITLVLKLNRQENLDKRVGSAAREISFLIISQWCS
jgi:hypothetical protein